MEIEVRLFAGAKEQVGADRVKLVLQLPANVAQLRRALSDFSPGVADLLARSRIAVDNQFVNDQHDLRPGMEVAVIPPVSGG